MTKLESNFRMLFFLTDKKEQRFKTLLRKYVIIVILFGILHHKYFLFSLQKPSPALNTFLTYVIKVYKFEYRILENRLP
jgi:hypothetical protein